MREIKFRAWDKHQKEMHQVRDIYWTKHHIVEDIGIAGEPCCWPAKETQLLQYTGLKDKSGKEIYEGDIMRGSWEPYPIIGVIEFQPPSFIMQLPKRKQWSEFIIRYKEPQLVEVIGNIYENPELLEKK